MTISIICHCQNLIAVHFVNGITSHEMYYVSHTMEKCMHEKDLCP